MPKSDPAEILLDHQLWSTRNLLDACAQLTDEQLDREFDMGVGSLRKTLTHILGALRGWGHLLAGKEQCERLEAQGPHTIARLIELNDQLHADFAASVAAHAQDGIATGSHGGKAYAFTRGSVLAHVTTHAMHHRAQCLNMLRQLGIDPLPPSAVLEWMMMVDPVEPPNPA